MRTDSSPASDVASHDASAGQHLGWALYLACSWTWCIGLYLPVLLYREFGLAGWTIFAIPNVVGAAALAWVLGDGTASRTVVARHMPAMAAFSICTIVFQSYFLGWLLWRMPVPAWAAGCLITAAIGWLGSSNDGRTRLVAAATWLFSAAVLVVGVVQERFLDRSVLEASRQGLPGSSLVWLAAACSFGFLLCPYLDLTFHHVRQRTTRRGGRWVFGMGFGVFFLAMILLSLAYAPRMTHIFGPSSADVAAAAHFWVAVLLHMVVQAGFTIVVHFRRLAVLAPPSASRAVVAAAVCGGAALLVPGLLPPRAVCGMDIVEFGYRILLGCYALVFPAYVLICVVPSRQTRQFSLRVCAATVVLAAPVYAWGFLGGPTAAVAPALAVVLAGRLIVGRVAST